MQREMAGRKPRTKTASSVVLGRYLQGLRHGAKLTLRDVEKKANGEVANAYLSQIENGYVQFPYPRCLYALAKVYLADYNQIIRMCYAPPEGEEQIRRNSNAELFSIDGLAREEFVALQAFLINHRQASRGNR